MGLSSFGISDTSLEEVGTSPDITGDTCRGFNDAFTLRERDGKEELPERVSFLAILWLFKY